MSTSDLPSPPASATSPGPPPQLPVRPPLSRPLSEISVNEPRWRTSNRSSVHSSKTTIVASHKGGSRPASQVRDKEDIENEQGAIAAPKRVSSAMGLPQTITVNLADYAKTAQHAPPSPLAESSTAASHGSAIGPNAGASASASKPELPRRPQSGSSRRDSRAKAPEADGEQQAGEADDKHQSAILVAQRTSLRPTTSRPASYAEAAKSPATATPSSTLPLAHPEPRTSSLAPPTTKSKPSWLKRGGKSKSPVSNENSPGPSSKPHPPVLPPRKNKANVPDSASLADIQSVSSSDSMGAPDISDKTSYASIASGPPPLPPRNNGAGVRGRIAAWTQAAAQSGGMTRSDSTQSLAPPRLAPQPTGTSQYRMPSSASRVFGHAGSAVSKGWAGLRSKGMNSSMSIGNLSTIAQNGPSQKSSRTSPLGGGKRDRLPSDNQEISGPIFDQEIVKRPPEGNEGKVFGREIVDAGREWGVVDAGFEVDGQSEWESRRRKCLPAVVVRCVDYLEIWGPKEEGIFRISGRSSHVATLKRNFDSGADIDLADCHPGDLDPHAVAGVFKSYLRELPAPLLTKEHGPKFEELVAKKNEKVRKEESTELEDEEFADLLAQLPQSHWFLLSELVKLLDLIPKHNEVNRMTLNALMLSLGPSLNIPGAVVTELMERRDVLFAQPPPPSVLEDAADLIDFGDVDIPLSAVPQSTTSSSFSLSSLPPSPIADDVATMSGSVKRKPPRLPTRPSITKLFSGSQVNLQKQKSQETLASITDVEPPRVDVTVSPTSPLPAFDKNGEEVTPHKRDTIRAQTAPAEIPIPAIASSMTIAEMDPTEEIHYAPGTVEERSKLFSAPATPTSAASTSTPIADRYTAGHSFFPFLRAPKEQGSVRSARSSSSVGAFGEERPGSAAGSIGSGGSGPNPVSVIRRGPPVFFQSSNVESRHVRSMSSVPSGDTGRSKSPSSSRRKRKEEMAGEEDQEKRNSKRLSAGPGVLDGVVA
ncbi:hypothetical protein L198_04059 [Cryptococcus wingfieldii CBS 7118]|uniref:Rho-GAP domain-containing protein n=1 Tax=Cryptococcus wingfieldii CBS 7118 TaxID=1295528 RepID=A0A1E3J9H0_9TREE|nr:hypothetical protein L198_04059 [Cryptococcus wingfieldii CBS 7118]ODN97492.1 hypothetical protein L198_04059 [Cryptococcus wingfieldii CBS 7118]